GTDQEPLIVDGVYGGNTKSAVAELQKEFGITADGAVGIETYSNLLHAINVKNGGNINNTTGSSIGYTGSFGSSGNPLTKSLESFKQIGIGLMDGAKTRADNAFNSTYDFFNWLTIGVLDGIVTSSAERAEKAFDSAYDFANWLTIGIPDMVKGALAPEEAFSAEHWLNSLGLASLSYSVLKLAVIDGSDIVTTADLQKNFNRYSNSITTVADDTVEETSSTTVQAEKISGSNIKHLNGAIGEAQGYNNALAKGEIGIQAPGKVTVSGPDYITFDPKTQTLNI
ncbi:MAG: peptidoglycan-binding domain-containing protein, partial [Bacillota bacterium]